MTFTALHVIDRLKHLPPSSFLLLIVLSVALALLAESL